MIRLVLRAFLCAALFALALAFPGPAMAGRGDGPYTPFPEDPTGRALDFLHRLDQRTRTGGDATPATALNPDQLTEGVKLAPPPRGAGTKQDRRRRELPFRQAGVASSAASSSPATWPFALVAALLAAAALAAAWTQRRRPAE